MNATLTDTGAIKSIGIAEAPNFSLSLIQEGVSKRYNNNKKRSHTQLDSGKQVIAFQDRVMTINIKEAQHPLK